MNDLKAKVEAVLFLSDKPMKAQAIAKIINADLQLVRQALIELIEEYETRNGGLEIAQDNGYIFEVKPEYAGMMEEFLPIEMSAALLRTLSAIALKQPVAQADIIKIRGAGAYDHIRELVQKELINKKEDGGRSPMLSTTKRFLEYFRLTKDALSLRKTLRKQDKQTTEQDEQLQLPLSEEEQQKQEQIETVLDNLLEVATEAGDEASGGKLSKASDLTVPQDFSPEPAKPMDQSGPMDQSDAAIERPEATEQSDSLEQGE